MYISVITEFIWHHTERHKLQNTTFKPYTTDNDWTEFYLDNVAKITVSSIDRCYVLHKIAQHCNNITGCFVECGVYRGGTALVLLNAAKYKTIYLYDTFTGLPRELITKEDKAHRQGDFSNNNINEVIKITNEHKGTNVICISPGIIPSTFDCFLSDCRVALLHIDVDLLKTTKDCLLFFYNKMANGGIMVFDEYLKVGTPTTYSQTV